MKSSLAITMLAILGMALAADDWVRIKNVNSGLYMDVNGASTAPGARVIQYQLNNGTNQVFNMKPQNDGWYAFQNQNSGLYLAINGSTVAQQSASSAQLVQQNFTGADNQLFRLVPSDDNNTYIISKRSMMPLDVNGASKNNSANVIQYPIHCGSNQKWTIEHLPPPPAGDWVRVKNVNSGLYMDVNGSSTAPGARIIQWQWHNGTNQIFNMIQQPDGWFSLQSQSSGLYLDINGASTNQNASLIQWNGTGAANQLFRLIPSDDGNTYILNKNSNMVIDVPGASTTAGTGLIQWPINCGGNQEFVVEHL